MPKAYRPITLFKILLKGMERAINWLLGERVVALALPNQHTYTRGLGTETALFSFSDPVESVFHRGYLTALGFFYRIELSSEGEALDALGYGWYQRVLAGCLVSADLPQLYSRAIF